MAGPSTPAACAEILRRALPQFAFASVEPVAQQGWDFACFAADGEWIARFPRNAAAARGLEREFALLPDLAARLPVAVPRYEWRGDWEGLPFGVYRRITGQANEPGAFTVPAIARQLGETLRALHGVPIELAAARLGEAPGRARWLAAQRHLHRESRTRARPLLDAASALRLHDLIEEFERFAAGNWSTCLVHNDLGPPHILGEIDQLTGIIDWSDMCLGDPAADFAGVLGFGGESALERVALAYDRPTGDAFELRVRYYACIAPLHDLLHGLDIGDDVMIRAGLEGFAERVNRWS